MCGLSQERSQDYHFQLCLCWIQHIIHESTNTRPTRVSVFCQLRCIIHRTSARWYTKCAVFASLSPSFSITMSTYLWLGCSRGCGVRCRFRCSYGLPRMHLSPPLNAISRATAWTNFSSDMVDTSHVYFWRCTTFTGPVLRCTRTSPSRSQHRELAAQSPNDVASNRAMCSAAGSTITSSNFGA